MKKCRFLKSSVLWSILSILLSAALLVGSTWALFESSAENLGNKVFTGLFSHTVTWVVDGQTTSESYAYGATPAYKGSTAKASDVQYDYTFTGWDKAVEAVTGDVTYTAVYQRTARRVTQASATDVNTIAAFDAINEKGTSLMSVHASATHNVATVDGLKLGNDCLLTLSGWSMMQNGQNGLYWSVDGTTWNAMTGGSYGTAGQDVVDAAKNAAFITNPVATNGRFASVGADLSDYKGHVLTVHVAVYGSGRMVEVLKLTNLKVGDYLIPVLTQSPVTNINTFVTFDAINHAAAGLQTLYVSGASIVAAKEGVVLSTDSKLVMSGWMLMNGGQDALYWSVDGRTWYACTDGQYYNAEQGVLNAAPNAQITNVSATNGRFADVVVDLSAYKGQTLTVRVAAYGSGQLVEVLQLTGVKIRNGVSNVSMTSGRLTVDLSQQAKIGQLSGWRTNAENPASQFTHPTGAPSLNLLNNGEIEKRGGAFVLFQGNVLTLNNVNLSKYSKLYIRATDNNDTADMVLIVKANGTEIGRVTTGGSRYVLSNYCVPISSGLTNATVTVEAVDSTTTAGFIAKMEFTGGTTTVSGLESANLNGLMDYAFAGGAVRNETVMFLDPGETKKLLYPASSVISVTDYTGTIVYQAGRDYILNSDGTITFPSTTTIPHLTSSTFYNFSQGMSVSYPWQNPYGISSLKNDNPVALTVNGKHTWWGETLFMTMFQANVNYTTNATWSGYKQASNLSIYDGLVEKMVKGEDVTVVFYGDSITWGASASGGYRAPTRYSPYQDPYAILFTKALADLFGYTVQYVDPNTEFETNGTVINGGSMETAPVPNQNYVAGNRGTITYLNAAIGGWTSADGVTYFDASLKPYLSPLGCDLFVIGFGMNDGNGDPTTYTKANVKTVVDKVLTYAPDADVVLVSTMVANNKGGGWYTNSIGREQPLLNLAAEYRAAGVDCAVSCMTSTSQAVLTRKDFHDYSGNNINHPNDYFARIYAQTLLQCVIGYENIK